ncbi:MAG: agmatine deiminase [Bradymonadia bacterium]
MWPWDGRIWGDAHESAKDAIATAAAIASRGEDVWVVVDARASDSIPLRLGRAGGELARLCVIEEATDDVWVRDSGPSYVSDATERVAIDWNFSAWGEKFPHSNDALLAAKLGRHASAKSERASLTLEGGALETNGSGVVLTTRSVVLNSNRNPGVSEVDAESEIIKRTGADQVVWLHAGMSNDDTDGHVDTLARFVSLDTVLVQALPDEQHALDERNRVALRSAGLRVVSLPNPCVENAPASYANFYFTNAAVLVPQYGTQHDAAAFELIASHVDRPVVAVDCSGLITQGGAIHCATQQVPI